MHFPVLERVRFKPVQSMSLAREIDRSLVCLPPQVRTKELHRRSWFGTPRPHMLVNDLLAAGVVFLVGIWLSVWLENWLIWLPNFAFLLATVHFWVKQFHFRRRHIEFQHCLENWVRENGGQDFVNRLETDDLTLFEIWEAMEILAPSKALQLFGGFRQDSETCRFVRAPRPQTGGCRNGGPQND